MSIKKHTGFSNAQLPNGELSSSANGAFSAGDTIALVVSSSSDLDDLSFSLEYTRG